MSNKPFAITFTPAEVTEGRHLLTHSHFDDPLWNKWDHEDTLGGATSPYVAGTKVDESGALYETSIRCPGKYTHTFEPANVSSLGESAVYMCV